MVASELRCLTDKITYRMASAGTPCKFQRAKSYPIKWPFYKARGWTHFIVDISTGMWLVSLHSHQSSLVVSSGITFVELFETCFELPFVKVGSGM